MQSHLFIGGHWDGLSSPVEDEQDAVQMPVCVTGKETYVRDTLSVGDVFINIYRHESLTSHQVLNLLTDFYKAWCVNRPGGRR